MGDNFHSEDWLALLFYGMDLLLDPKPYKWLQSFEQWEYRNRLRPQLRSLQRAKLLRRCGSASQSTWGMTARGQLAACGGVDPPRRWLRPWDGRWRLLTFDLPLSAHLPRLKLWRWLRGHRYGLMQKSVWIIPDPVDESGIPLDRLKLNPLGMLVLEAHASGTTSDGDLVKHAWDFEQINQRYQTVLQLAAQGRALAQESRTRPTALRRWLALERVVWREAVAADPFLPAAALPGGYLGRQAWEERQRVYRVIAERGLQDRLE